MPRFFVSVPPTDTAVITGEDAVHIGRSLRMRPGERLTVCCDGTDHECEIEAITSDEVRCRVLSSAPTEGEPRLRLTLFQALPKSDKMELIVQKTVELGVSEIVPVVTERCVSRPDDKSAAKKTERWQKIALSAAKQCGRGIIPTVSLPVSFEKCLGLCKESERRLFCYEGGGESLTAQRLDEAGSAALLIGPEGGFSDEEAAAAKAAGLVPVTLGKRILRCETAPIAATAAVMLLAGEM
ncbi:MAG: 16S rRNA (uracil(1498)-N(3))-methyltransferase [Ruminococcus sp.]|nr:16S rRNA (uracil(1498)-N(3))-methyltransferase [Ruminococcus sp.]